MLPIFHPEDSLVGFFDYNACNTLSLEPDYFIEIIHAELVGSTVYLVIELWLDNKKQGLLCEAYDTTGAEFERLVKIFFESEAGRVFSVTTGDLECVNGTAKLKKCGERIAIDWATFDAEQLSCGDLSSYYS